MSEQTIFNDLRNAGMSVAGACAMIGNMKAESSMKPNIAQRGMTKLTDEEYTAKFDRQPETCYKDGVGYGLCQWTFHTRKQNLRQFSSNWGVSVGAEDMQTAFAVYELKTDNKDLWNYLCSNCDIYTATERICKEFERPAVNNISTRYNFALDFYNRLASTENTNKSADASAESLDVETCLQGALWDILSALGIPPDANGGLAGALRKYADEVS